VSESAPVQPAQQAASASRDPEHESLLGLIAQSGVDARTLTGIIAAHVAASAAGPSPATAPAPSPALAPAPAPAPAPLFTQQQLHDYFSSPAVQATLVASLRHAGVDAAGPSSSISLQPFANGGGGGFDPFMFNVDRLNHQPAPVKCSTYKPKQVRAFGKTCLVICKRFAGLPLEMVIDHCVVALDDRGRRWASEAGGSDHSDFKSGEDFVDRLLGKFVGDKARDHAVETFAAFEPGGMVLATVQRHVARCEADVEEVVAARGNLPLDSVFYLCETHFRKALPSDVGAAVKAALDADKLSCGKQRFEFVLETAKQRAREFSTTVGLATAAAAAGARRANAPVNNPSARAPTTTARPQQQSPKVVDTAVIDDAKALAYQKEHTDRIDPLLAYVPHGFLGYPTFKIACIKEGRCFRCGVRNCGTTKCPILPAPPKDVAAVAKK